MVWIIRYNFTLAMILQKSWYQNRKNKGTAEAINLDLHKKLSN
jgi:hypothetical protein